MKQERTQYPGHYGVVLILHPLTVTPLDRAGLQRLQLSESGFINYEINDLVMSLYDRMQAKDLECEMLVAISKPLLREQADMFNKQRISVVGIIGSSVGFIIKPFSKVAAFVSATAASAFVSNQLRTYHQGDVIVSAQASVSGGIGPQRSSMSLLINSGRRSS